MEKRWIWPFELLDKLGEGGMGVVYRARYVVDNRHVAVKLLPPNIANETILSRFERELEILKTMRHPNIVRCFGGVCEGNQHFYAMELVEGGTLDRLLEERGKFSWETAVQFALQMSSGLAYAHERGVVHRDVKPGNFLLTPNGKLKLSDFGLATVEAAAKITAAGKTMGTFPYMAPEQIRGRPPVSPQTDLYALGCVIFEMLTGRTPFSGSTPAEVMHKHLEEVPPRITDFASACPVALEALVRDLLQKDPSDRPESAVTVAKRLMDAGDAIQVSSVSAPVAAKVASTPPKGVLVAPSLEKSTGKRSWILPLLGAILCLSLAWNLQALRSVSDEKRAERLWVQAFRSGRPEIRDEAAKALGELSADSSSALATLVDGLSDPDPTVRMSAVDGLSAAGGAARSAVTELYRVQKADDNEIVRQKAVAAVNTIQHSPRRGSGSGSIWFWIVGVVIVAGIAAGFALRGTATTAMRRS